MTLSFCSASRIRWSCQKWRQLSPLYEGTVQPQGTCLGRISSVLSKLKTTLGTYLKNLLISMIWKTRYAVHDLSSSHAWKALETSSSLSHTYLVFVLQVRLCHLCPSQISLKLFYPNFGFLQNYPVFSLETRKHCNVISNCIIHLWLQLVLSARQIFSGIGLLLALHLCVI